VANTFFQFKKFIVHQEHTAMKVCTDACLFGAWSASDSQLLQANTILDIGTGTGLLSLMLAQATENTNSQITAIEIEVDAAKEAASNFELSPWASRMTIVNSAIQDFANDADYADTKDSNDSKISKFDCIITNPPFYEGDLKSPDNKKNLASHNSMLTWEDLVKCVSQLLNEGGSYYVLIPALRSYTMQKLCDQNGLQLVEEVLVHNNAKTLPIRAMQKFIKPNTTTQINSTGNNTSAVIKRNKIFIKDSENKYDTVFSELLKTFYLQF
jgi:tRNA1Val (adenine37-N6)-methyltransferase